jgi:hypothetical protein
MMPTGLDLLWVIVSFILTVLVFSYFLGENVAYRFVMALFIGISAGYFAVVLIFQVILPRLVVPLISGDRLVLIPLILSGLLMLKLTPRFSRMGNLPMAYLVGAGAAIAVGGAVMGTLFGQVKGAWSAFAPSFGELPFLAYLEGGFLLIGTLASLAYFHFNAKKGSATSGKRTVLGAIFAWIGKIFISITLGVVFASVLTAAATALIERTDFILQTIRLFSGK